MKNPSDPMLNPNGDLPACNAAPPPNAPPNVLSANYRGADKSLARPGRKQANVSVRMA